MTTPHLLQSLIHLARSRAGNRGLQRFRATSVFKTSLLLFASAGLANPVYGQAVPEKPPGISVPPLPKPADASPPAGNAPLKKVDPALADILARVESRPQLLACPFLRSYPGQASAPVQVAAVERRTVSVYEEVVGTVRPRYRAAVAAKITGRIIRASADAGARVQKDQLLAELDVRELRATRDLAQANLDDTKRNWERYRRLEPGKVASKAQIDQAEMAYRMAKASAEEIDRRLEDANIAAPFAGAITRRLMDADDLATPGAPLYELEDPGIGVCQYFAI